MRDFDPGGVAKSALKEQVNRAVSSEAKRMAQPIADLVPNDIVGKLLSGGGAEEAANALASAAGQNIARAVGSALSLLQPNGVDLAFSFEAPAASGAFQVLGFEGQEEISELFEVTVDLVSDDSNIDLHSLLDTPAVLGILHKYDAPRFLNGVIAEVEKGQSGIRRTYYRATLKPALHRLQYISDSRIFQDMSVPEISRAILEEYGVPNCEWRLEMKHQIREYCVQYGETAYDFLRRIWAEEGIFFWFDHASDAHTMIISDAPLAMPLLKQTPALPFNAMTGGTAKAFWVNRFEQVERLRATNRVSADYTFKRPAYHQRQKAVEYASNGSMGQYELYEYPGRHKDPGAGGPFNDYGLHAHRVDATTAHGETNGVQLSAGFCLNLSGHPDLQANTNHRLLQVYHSGAQPSALREDAPEDGATQYRAQFTSQPSRLPYYPVNPMPKPMVEGPQIAHVTGPEGEEIYCDEHGRVKIWFPWDRRGEKNEKSSCWVRVSQGWAGGSWGSMAIPRIGQEVVVDFLGGDPDQPIITGRTYHATNRPPYALPEHKTKMVIRSDTHKGTGFNEFSFEDEAGKENIALHAQKDQTLKVLNNRMKRVDNDQIESVGTNKSIDVGNNHQEKISGSMNLSVGGGGAGLFAMLAGLIGGAGAAMKAGADDAGDETATAFVGGLAEAGVAGEALSAGGSASFLSAGANRRIAGAAQASAGTALGAILSKVMPTSGIMNVIVEKAKSETVGVAATQQVGVIKNTMVGAIQNTTVGKNSNTTVGDTMTVEVGEELIFKVGKSQLTLKKDGTVRLVGDNLNITMENDVQIYGNPIDLN